MEVSHPNVVLKAILFTFSVIITWLLSMGLFGKVVFKTVFYKNNIFKITFFKKKILKATIKRFVPVKILVWKL